MRTMFLPLALAFGLSACGSVVPRTLIALNALDPFTANPAGFAVGMVTDAGLGLQPGTATLTFEAIHSPSGETWTRVLPLAEDRTDEDMVIYMIQPEGVADLRAMQAELVDWKDTSDGNSTLSLNVFAKGCRVPGMEIGEDPRVSVFMQLAVDAPMRPLVRNGSILDMFDVAELAELPQCSG